MRLSRLLSVSPPIRKALPANLSEGFYGALRIVDTLSRAVGEAEVEFIYVALQMRFGNVVIGSVQATLEKPEVGFDGVAVDSTRASVLTNRVIDSFMPGKFFTESHTFVVHRVVRVNLGLLSDVRGKDGLQVLGVDTCNVETARSALTINKRNDLAQMWSASTLNLRTITEAALTT